MIELERGQYSGQFSRMYRYLKKNKLFLYLDIEFLKEDFRISFKTLIFSSDLNLSCYLNILSTWSDRFFMTLCKFFYTYHAYFITSFSRSVSSS